VQTSPPKSGAIRPRVGHIQYLNCLPLYDGLVRSGALLDVDLRKDTPDHLNDALIRGDLDIGPISLVPALRHSDDLVVLPGIAVGSDGPVLSVVMVSPYALEELDGRRIALGSQSRTSVLLARMLLEQRYGAHCSYDTMPPDVTAMLLEADAAVVIGDVALRAMDDPRGLHVYDLGQLWKDWTGLPMVFAVWAARREYWDAEPGLVKDVHRAFTTSLADSLAQVDDVAARAARWETFTPGTLARYFRTLDFSLGDRQIRGIDEFADRAAAIGGLPAGRRLTLAPI
jgi:chorismate dehydratase